MKMKRAIVFISFITISFAALAQAGKRDSGIKESRYCASMGDGKIIVKSDGVELKKDIKLPNGNQILTNGVILKNNGSKLMMNNGDCADKDGNIIVNTVDDKIANPKGDR